MLGQTHQIKASSEGRAIHAASEMGHLSSESLTAIEGVAYSGGPLTQYWSSSPVYVDLAGLAVRAQVPLLYNHYNSPLSRIGVLSASVSDGQLKISGGIDSAADGAAKLIAMGRKIPWQLSINAMPEQFERLEANLKTSVNGREVTGPALIARKSTLNEVSVVAVGADAETHLKICASLNLPSQHLSHPTPTQKEPTNMLTERLRAHLQAKYGLAGRSDAEIIAHLPTINSSLAAEEAELNAAQPIQAAAPAAQSAAAPAPAPAPQPVAATAAAQLDPQAIAASAVQAERQRITEIDGICVRHPEIAARARSENWDANRTRAEVLAAINASYQPATPHINVRDNTVSQGILASAALQAVGTPAQQIEAAHGREALDAADRRWRGGIGLQELIIEAAIAGGAATPPRRLTKGNWYNVTEQAIRASGTGVSEINLSGLLGGVVSRSLLQGFGVVDSSWEQIAGVRPVNDFREIVSYRLSSDGGFEQVGATGELKHGKLSEVSYRNKAATYGKLLGATREDIINDDLGALASIPHHLGLDAGMKLNEVIWKEFLDNASFFTEGAGNLVPGNALGIDGLSGALRAFRALKDESGRMLGSTPSILLVPPSLEILAGQLYKDQAIIALGLGSSAKVAPASNPHTGKYAPVTSPYLEDSTLSGNSATAYYLLAKPAFRAAIQVVFLNGVRVPTIESSELTFSQLGIQFRAYFDFGARKMDPLAGIKVQGNA